MAAESARGMEPEPLTAGLAWQQVPESWALAEVTSLGLASERDSVRARGQAAAEQPPRAGGLPAHPTNPR